MGAKKPQTRGESQMTEKYITGECESCESTFEISFSEELVSDDMPTFCPFCGEQIDDLQEEYIDDDEDEDENKGWD